MLPILLTFSITPKPRWFWVDREFSGVVDKALKLCTVKPLIIDIDDSEYTGGELIGERDYEAFIAQGDADFDWQLPLDEWQTISLNYTSGTTGNPKGVVYHHRGAYLLAMGNIITAAMPSIHDTCGLYRCFTAMAGVSPGRCQSLPEPMCVCAGSTQPTSFLPAMIMVSHTCAVPRLS